MPKAAHTLVAGIAAKYGGRLRRYLSLKLRNPADVPDLAQEVFLRLLRVRDDGVIRSPEAYLFTVASHVLHQHAVRRAREPTIVDIDEVFSEFRSLASDEPPAQVDSAQRLRTLEKVLAPLPPRIAAALVMHKIGGYTVQEIGDELGVARETVKKYLARAAEHCRNHRAALE